MKWNLLLLTTSAVLLAESTVAPQIDYVTVTDSPPQITIKGTNFGSAMPIVKIDEIQLRVDLNTDSMIVAGLPTLLPLTAGTYALTVANGQNHQTGSLAAAIGVIGPQGPKG